MAVTNSRFILSVFVLAALSTTLFAAEAAKCDKKCADVIGPRDESAVGCPKFTTRKPADGEIQITTAPMKLDKPGKYILMNDISVPASAFAITSPGVELDLNGQTITYGTGVKLTDPNSRGIMTYTAWRKGGNFGHSAIIIPDGPYNTQDWPDTFTWNGSKRGVAKGLIIRNGRIVQGTGEGLAFSPALRLDGANEAEVYNLIVDVHAPDSEAIIFGPQSKIHHCTFNDKVRKVSNRHANLGVVVLSKGSEVYNCMFEGGPQTAVKATEDNIIHDNIMRMNVIATNGYGVVGWKARNVTVHHNRIIPYDGRGIHCSEHSSGWDVHHNYIEIRNGPNKEYPKSMEEHGIKLEQTKNSKVYNNVVLSVSIPGGRPTPLNMDIRADSNNKVYGNTFIAMDRHGKEAWSVYLLNADGTTTAIEDNTFYTNKWSVHFYWSGANNNTFRRCRFRRIETGKGQEFVDFGNTKPARNNVFVDCEFMDGIDPRSAYVHPGEDNDWRGDADYSIAWSLALTAMDGKAKLAGADVTIMDSGGKKVASGKTDSEGKFAADLKEFTVAFTKADAKLRTIEHGAYTVTIASAESDKQRQFEISPAAPMVAEVDMASSAPIKTEPRPAVKPDKDPLEEYWRKRMELAVKEMEKTP